MLKTGLDAGKAKGSAIVSVVILLFAIYYSLIAKNTDLSFDGAIYSQGTISLLKHGVYVNYLYNNEDISKLKFSIYPQGMLSQYILNAPLTKLFGISNFSLQINNIIFLCLSAVLLFSFMRNVTKNYYLAVLSVVLFFTFPGVAPSPLKASVSSTSLVPASVMIPSLALGGFGEVPAFFYMLLTTIILYEALENEKYFPLLGLSLYLAFEAKFFLILILPILLVVLFFTLEGKARLRNIFVVLLTFSLPVLFLNLLFLKSYGWEEIILYYKGFWQKALLQQYGSAQADLTVLDWIRKGMASISTGYGGLLGFYVPLAAGYFTALLAIVFRTRKKIGTASFPTSLRLDRAQAAIAFLLFSSVIYVVWWFHLSTAHQWYRKILPLLLLNIPLYILALSYLYGRLSSSPGWKKTAAVLGLVILLPIVITQLKTFVASFEVKTKEDQALKDRKEIVEVIARIPEDEKIFGVGWWQAPRLSLFSGRVFLDIEKNRTYKKGYLVFENEALRFGREAIKKTLERYDVELIGRNSNYEIYRWKEKRAAAL